MPFEGFQCPFERSSVTGGWSAFSPARCARVAAAEPDFRGATGIGKRRTAVALPKRSTAYSPRSTRSIRHWPPVRGVRCLWCVRGVHADRARRASRCADHRAGRQRIDQDRADPRYGRPRGVSAIRRAPARRHHRRGGRARRGGAERPSENARGAAFGFSVHPGYRAARRLCCRPCGRAARDFVSGRCMPTTSRQRSTARGLSTTEARAVAATADGSLGRALEASAGDFVEAREIAHRVLAQAAAPADRARRIEARKTCWRRPVPAARPIASSLRPTFARWRRCCEMWRCWHCGRTSGRWPMPTFVIRSTADRRTAVTAEPAPSPPSTQALVALQRNAGVKIVADWLVLQSVGRCERN